MQSVIALLRLYAKHAHKHSLLTRSTHRATLTLTLSHICRNPISLSNSSAFRGQKQDKCYRHLC